MINLKKTMHGDVFNVGLALPTISKASTSDKNKVVNVPDEQLGSYLKSKLGVKTLTRGAMPKSKKY